MITNREKFLGLVSTEITQTLENNRSLIANRYWLQESQTIAIKILDKLDALNWSQKDLAEKMGVSPQYINKVIKGKENLSLDTITKFQQLLKIPLLASYYEANTEKVEELIVETAQILPDTFSNTYSKETRLLKISFELNTDSFIYSKVG